MSNVAVLEEELVQKQRQLEAARNADADAHEAKWRKLNSDHEQQRAEIDADADRMVTQLAEAIAAEKRLKAARDSSLTVPEYKRLSKQLMDGDFEALRVTTANGLPAVAERFYQLELSAVQAANSKQREMLERRAAAMNVAPGNLIGPLALNPLQWLDAQTATDVTVFTNRHDRFIAAKIAELTQRAEAAARGV